MYVPLNRCYIYKRVRNSILGIEGIRIRRDVLKAFDLSKILENREIGKMRYLVQIPIMDVINGNDQIKRARANEELILRIDAEMHKSFWENGFREAVLLKDDKLCRDAPAVDRAIYFIGQKEYIDIVEFGFSFRYDANGLPNFKEYGLKVNLSQLPKLLRQREHRR